MDQFMGNTFTKTYNLPALCLR